MTTLDGRTILILEDELIIAFALEDLLTGMGAEVVLASTLEEAAARLADTQISLAVLDVNVHGLKSYGIAEALTVRGVPLIFATGYGIAEHPPQFAAFTTLTKPYNRYQLTEAIAAMDQ
jgi:DNA-binding NtrC family response regulator